MKRKKAIFSVLGIVCAAAILVGVIGWRLYHQERSSLTGTPADIAITATELYKAFFNDEQDANRKYLNKVILVSGTVSNITVDSTGNSIGISAGKEAMGEINCQMGGNSSLTKKGETISLKGRCTGYLMDVMLVDAIIVKQ